jgi:hypothetical protein
MNLYLARLRALNVEKPAPRSTDKTDKTGFVGFVSSSWCPKLQIQAVHAAAAFRGLHPPTPHLDA